MCYAFKPLPLGLGVNEHSGGELRLYPQITLGLPSKMPSDVPSVSDKNNSKFSSITISFDSLKLPSYKIPIQFQNQLIHKS